jgi:predicted glycogen debranching enzyme
MVAADVCRDFDRSSRLEWLETNHTGAFAMGTVAGVNTRRYHALLIASLNPPADRFSILSRVEETVNAGGREFELGAAQYPGEIHPRGFEFLEDFRIDPFPAWRYQTAEIIIRKTLCLMDGQQSVLVRYEATGVCQLTVRLFASCRDYHSLARQNSALAPTAKSEPGRIEFAPYPGLPPLTVFHSGFAFSAGDAWYLNNEYPRELERGLDFREDLFSPGSISFQLAPDRTAWFVASVDSSPPGDRFDDTRIDAILTAEASRRHVKPALARALDQFRVTRFDGKPSLIAGYPWFTDWSRDTLISLPALALAGFPDSEIAAILTMLLEQRSQGLLPNRFADRRSIPEYNTVDATLWFFIAADDFIRRTDDRNFLRSILYPAARDILHWHHRGTFYNIVVDAEDHLLSAGAPGVQLTWMDAKIGDYVVTPRAGKPVEVNALWYNALRIASAWAESLGFEEESANHAAEAAATRASFEKKFWNHQHGCLYDLLTPGSHDAAIRPNQLFAVSLPYPLLDPERAQSLVNVVRETLLTPVGLRTLDPADPAYRPRFEGDMANRDAAYHQGTVWPWLIGPFVTAYLYAFGRTDAALTFCRQIVNRLDKELYVCCLGSLSEVYDGMAPQSPGGCPAQLWSLAQRIIAGHCIREAKPPAA